MATTFTLEIKKTPTSKGKFPIYIRVTKERKLKRIKSSVELSRLSDWNGKGAKNHNWVRSSERNAVKWNDALAKELEEAEDIYRDNKDASAESIVKKIRSKSTSTSFLAFAKAHAEELGALGKSNAKHYETFCNKLEAFLESVGRSDVSFLEITPAFLSDFENFLRKDKNAKVKDEKRLHPNYIRTLLVKFRALVNKAISEELMPVDKYPFRSHPIPKEVETGKEALDAKEIDAIKALEYPEGSGLWNTKNAFLFSFYCAGIRVGDLLQLRWRNIKDGERLEYVMGKNHKQRNFPLVSQAKHILQLYRTDESMASDYIFPLLDSAGAYAKELDVDVMPVELKKKLFAQIYSKTTLLNRNLKEIAFDAKIHKALSFHISRHSFASLAREKSVPSKMVQEALAHSSLTTTERYLHNFSTEEVDNTLQKVFNGNQSKQDALLDALKGLDEKALNELLGKLKKSK